MSNTKTCGLTSENRIQTMENDNWKAGDVAILKARHPVLEGSSRLKVTYRLDGDMAIQYVALGWRTGGRFHHCKHIHVSCPGEYCVILHPDDLVMKLEMGWTHITETCEYFELWCKFSDQSSGQIQISSIEIIPFGSEDLSIPDEDVNKFCYDMLTLSGLSKYEKASELADQMVKTSALSLGPYDTIILTESGGFVNGYEALSNSHKYMYHALGHVRIFLVAFHRTGRHEFLFQARQHTNDWMTRNFDIAPEDLKYSYYDHGAAERLGVLCALWAVLRNTGASVTDTKRLQNCMIAHARLLASWPFAGRHQPIFIHNHVVFQAIFCIMASLVAKDHPESQIWLDYGSELLALQMDGLLSSEHISIENSTGYHLGLHRILENSISLLFYVTRELPPALLTIRDNIGLMGAFIERVRYSGHNMPAIGDTKYTLNRSLKNIPPSRRKQLHYNQILEVFTDAGYASIKDDIEGVGEVSIVMVASALSQTHKHDDDLSISVATNTGIEWIADPGFHQYDESEPSLYARSVHAHNALFVLGELYTRDNGLCSIVDTSAAGKIAVTACHQHYDGIEIERRLEWAPEFQTLIIEDTAVGDFTDGHLLELNLILGDDVIASAINNREWQLSHASGHSGPRVVFLNHDGSMSFDARLFLQNRIISTMRLHTSSKASGKIERFQVLVTWSDLQLSDLCQYILPKSLTEKELNDISSL